jgi:hypothetical protein
VDDEKGDKGTAVIAANGTIIVALIAGAVGLATGYFAFASKDEELKVHLIELAIGILRADPKEDVAPARAWAIDVIEKKSGVPFSEADRAALLHKPIETRELTSLLTEGLVKNVTVTIDNLKRDFPPEKNNNTEKH